MFCRYWIALREKNTNCTSTSCYFAVYWWARWKIFDIYVCNLWNWHLQKWLTFSLALFRILRNPHLIPIDELENRLNYVKTICKSADLLLNSNSQKKVDFFYYKTPETYSILISDQLYCSNEMIARCLYVTNHIQTLEDAIIKWCIISRAKYFLILCTWFCYPCTFIIRRSFPMLKKHFEE